MFQIYIPNLSNKVHVFEQMTFNLNSLFRMGNKFSPLKKHKKETFFIYYENELLMEWLLKNQNFLKRVLEGNHDEINDLTQNLDSEDFWEKNRIIGFKSRNGLYGLDLQLMNNNFTALEGGDELEIITEQCINLNKPLYSLNTTWNSIRIANYEVLQTIGKGGFSLVYVVRCLETAHIFALKSMNIKTIKHMEKYDFVINEIKILKMISHPFIVKMYDVIEKNIHTHWVLDFWPGGDLFFLQSQFTRFPEKVAKFYMWEIVLALEYLHSMDIFYRDLKPTNVLIDSEGHVKLTDFGLSVPYFSEAKPAKIFWGTPEYMAPEMLLMIGHDKKLDYYSLGIILYEMLVGIPPFFSNDRREMYTSILKDDILFHPFISKTAKDLIMKLTQKDPVDRLGAEYGFFEIKQHPFFKDVDWQKYYDKEIIPPYVPDVRQLNFLPEFTEIPIGMSFHNSYAHTEPIEEMNSLEKSINVKNPKSTRHSNSIIQNRKDVVGEHKDWLLDYRNVSKSFLK